MKNLSVFLLLFSSLFVSNNGYSQPWKFKMDGCYYTSGGYVSQRENMFEFSGPILNFRNDKSFIGIGPAVQFTYHEKKLYVPFGGGLQFGSRIQDNIGYTLDLMYIFRKTFDQELNILTPQIGIYYRHFHIKYGYNFAMNDDLFPWISKNKISIMFRIAK